MPEAGSTEAPPASILLRSFDPATGEVVREFRPSTADELADAVAQARAAAPAWAALCPGLRAKAMAEVRHEIHRRMDVVRSIRSKI